MADKNVGNPANSTPSVGDNVSYIDKNGNIVKGIIETINRGNGPVGWATILLQDGSTKTLPLDQLK